MAIGVTTGQFVAAGSAGATSSGTDAQAGTFQLMNLTTNLCAGPSVKPETSGQVVQRRCTGLPATLWAAQPIPESITTLLVNQSTGLCMDLADGAGDDLPVVLARCSPKLVSQQWQFVTGEVPGRVKIVNGKLGQCLEVEDGEAPVGAPVQVSACVFSARHQIWQTGVIARDVK
ncbi:RICIN domain-containing protein [Amycolatopsis sp. H6(2020)]|nr:RICIN domain-containing protein [Amycolatopsis sp. H6(2020)]